MNKEEQEQDARHYFDEFELWSYLSEKDVEENFMFNKKDKLKC